MGAGDLDIDDALAAVLLLSHVLARHLSQDPVPADAVDYPVRGWRGTT